jgi:hypothetical protein
LPAAGALADLPPRAGELAPDEAGAEDFELTAGLGETVGCAVGCAAGESVGASLDADADAACPGLALAVGLGHGLTV